MSHGLQDLWQQCCEICLALGLCFDIVQPLSGSSMSHAGQISASQHKLVLCALQITFGLGAALRAGVLNAKSVKILRSAALCGHF